MRESDLIEHLLTANQLLPPLHLSSAARSSDIGQNADVFLTARFAGKSLEFFNFLVEVKAQSTPQAIHQAISQVKSYVKVKDDPDVHPMILVPFLSEDRLRELESEQVSGIDLCGNGIVTIPGRQLIYRTGNVNRHPESRPLSNPFHGKSAMVGRMFLSDPAVVGGDSFDALGSLRGEIRKMGIEISLPQVSKAVAALREERVLGSKGRTSYLLDPNRLMDRLATFWKPGVTERLFIKLPEGIAALSRLGNDRELHWAVTGVSSVGRYSAFGQGGPVQVAVSNLRKAMTLLGGEKESVPNFADIQLLASEQPGYYFGNEIDERGIRWAGRLQTWIELRNGDARQKDAAKEIFQQILS